MKTVSNRTINALTQQHTKSTNCSECLRYSLVFIFYGALNEINPLNLVAVKLTQQRVFQVKQLMNTIWQPGIT